jgi:hypothetical protein
MKNWITLCVFLGTSLLYAQQPQPVTKIFPLSSAYDAGNEVLTTPDGGYVVAGRVRINGKDDIFLQRLDAEGNQRWLKFYGTSTLNEGLERGIVALDNSWLIAGSQNATPTGPIGFLVRVNDSGQELWSKTITLPGVRNVGFSDLAPVAWGGFLAVGTADGKMLAVKLSDNGTVEWHYIGSEGAVKAVVLSASGANAYLMSNDKIVRIRMYQGVLTWEKNTTVPIYGDPDGYMDLILRDMLLLPGNRIAVVGSISNDQPLVYRSAYYLGVWSQDGQFLWEKFYNDAILSDLYPTEATSIQYLPNTGDLLIGGNVNGSLLFIRTDLSGNVLSSSTVSGLRTSIFQTVKKQNGYYFATGAIFSGGNVNTFFYRSAGNWMARPTQNTNHSGVAQTYPNPCTDHLTLEYDATHDSEVLLQCFNTVGKLVFTRPMVVAKGHNRVALDFSGQPAGLYWLSAPELGLNGIRVLKD